MFGRVARPFEEESDGEENSEKSQSNGMPFQGSPKKVSKRLSQANNPFNQNYGNEANTA